MLHTHTLEWCTLALFGDQLPEARWGHSMLTMGDKILIFGGINLTKYCESVVFEVSLDEKEISRYL